jgi:hypothetical protein
MSSLIDGGNDEPTSPLRSSVSLSLPLLLSPELRL